MLVTGLAGPSDFDFVFTGLNRMLNNVHEAKSTYIPGGIMQVSSYQELLVLLWKILEENPVFTSYLLKSCDVSSLVVPICYLLLANRKDVSKGGLIHINTFILLKLSGERNFGVSLNKPYNSRLAVDLPLFTGSQADLLILTLHKLVVSGNERLGSLYHCFLTVICNISPYCKSMSLVASMKLVSLFELYTSPRFLYASENNLVYVSLLMEVFNNIIQYQYIGNPHLVYAIIRRKEVFQRLYSLSLPEAISAAQEHATAVAQARAAVAAGEASASAAAASGGGGGGGDGGERSMPPPPAGEGAAGAAAGADGAEEDAAAPSQTAAAGSVEPPMPLPRFMPTEEWLSQVQAELPLNTIMRLLQYLVPQIDDLCSAGTTVDEATVVEFLRNTTMVGLLPVPHPIVIRKYQPNHYTSMWFTAFMWGVIFVRNQELPIFDGESIRLFQVTLGG